MSAVENIEHNYLSHDQVTLADYVAAVNRHKVSSIVVAAIIIFIALGLTFGLPAIYQSSGTVLIEEQEIPTELVQSTITTFADQRIQVIEQRVLTTENLSKLIEKYKLYQEDLKEDPFELIIETMREGDISVDPLQVEVVDAKTGRATSATIAFTVSYKNESPELAQRVANELVTLFLNENLKSRTETTEETTSFLEEEAKKLNTEIQDLEKRLATFKEENVNALPELVQLNYQLLDRTENSITNAEQQVQRLEERIIYLQSELSQIPPYSQTISSTGERILSPEGRLKALEADYLQLIAAYSEEHPDVKKMKKEIEALRKETSPSKDIGEIQTRLDGVRGELAGAKQKYAADHPDIKRLERALAGLQAELVDAKANSSGDGNRDADDADNPAYIQLQAQLDAARAEKRSNEAKIDELRAKMDDIELRLTNAPKVEREYSAITREYETATKKFQEVTAKLLAARMAQSLEAERKGERFTLIEPPLLPEEPISPNRPAIAFLGLVLAVAGGIGTIALFESVDSSVRGTKGISRLIGMPPLAVIPYIETAADKRRKLFARLIIAGALVIGLIVAGLIIHNWVMPLDVLWFKVVAKVGG